jgi:abortive infection bacteriophage resistance protein
VRYDKPPLSIDRQIDLLVSRGMIIQDRDRAARYLTHINYYRLRAYWLPFEEHAESGEHRFKPGTEFAQAMSLYVFDRKFRLLVLEAIERVEVSFRTRFAYTLGNKYGSHAYLDTSLFRVPYIHDQCVTSFREEFTRSRETFIEHYKTKYRDPELPPIWAACEIMSFGQLSKWFGNIKQRPDRQEIAREFNIDESILGSFMHHLTHIRNIVAHHSRLWNRRVTVTMSIPNRPRETVGLFNRDKERNIYNTLVMLGYLLNIMSPGTTWPARVRQLLEANTFADPTYMGFHINWRELSLWGEAV